MRDIAGYIKAARILLQDTVEDYRYSDDEMLIALDLAFLEAYRIRPDFFARLQQPPTYVDKPPETLVLVPMGYQSAFLYYIVGHLQLRDAEATEDARASVFLNKFVSQLLTTQA